MIRQEMMEIVSQREIAASIFKLSLKGELVKEMKEPGQFVHLKAGEGTDPLLRRPISISGISRREQEFTMIYRADGKGTALLSQKRPGDRIDVLGPLGSGFSPYEADAGETALLIGGGIGVPPLYELSKQLTEKGVRAVHILGFQTKEAVFYEAEFSRFGRTIVTTADGTYGKKGFVTDVLGAYTEEASVIYACGPTMMLRALESFCSGKKLFVSLEERMGCGIGACFACVCRTAGDTEGFGYKKVCTDGPVFRAGEVVI